MSIADRNGNRQIASISAATIYKISRMAKFVRISPEMLAQRDATAGNIEHVEQARTQGQKDFLLVVLPFGGHVKRHEIAELVHSIRGKGSVSLSKVDGLGERGYMLIPEPDVIDFIKRIIPQNIIEPSSAELDIVFHTGTAPMLTRRLGAFRKSPIDL